jgi:hypothetical protein
MDIQYSQYELIPKKRANRLSSLEPKAGVYLRAQVEGIHVFADYFPHAVLGDKPVDFFLQTFKYQDVEYDKKVFHLLRKDHLYRQTPSTPFFNHQLWTGVESLKSPIVKYKILNPDETLFLEILRKGIRMRFDGNACFTRETLAAFMEAIPKEHLSLIDYIEDPLRSTDWANLPLKSARDFITGSPYAYLIHKPNAEFFPKESVPVIFSGYLGSELGFWHSYAELIELGSLKLTHGLIIEDFYEHQRPLFKGDYFRDFVPDMNAVRNMYQELHLREWKHLCSM